MATRPGGNKSVTASLDFLVQMQGIGPALAEFTGLSNMAQTLEGTIREIGRASKDQFGMAIELAEGEYKQLSQISDIRTTLNEQGDDKLKLLRERLKIQGESPTDRKEALDQLTEELEQRKQLTEELRDMNQAALLYSASMSLVEAAGKDAFGALKDSVSGVTGKQKEVDEGLNILQSSFTKTMEVFKALGKTKELGEGIEFKDKAKTAFVDAAESIKVKELRVATLLFDEAVKSEASPIDAAKSAIKGGEEGGKGRGGIFGRAKKLGQNVTKMGGKLTSAGGKMQQFSVKMAKMGKTGKALGPAVGKVGGAVSKLGGIASKVGPAITQLTTAIVAGGPVVWAIAAAVILTVGVAIMSVAAAAKYLYEGMKTVIANMEEYRLVNYRALGSMHELMDATYDVSKATGLSNEQSMAAIKALSHVGVTANDLTKQYGNSGKALRDLAVMQGQFTRMTKANAESIATLQKRLMVGGVSMKAMQRTLDRTSMTMRKFGITGKDANEFMSTLSTSLLDMNAIYSGTDIDDYVDAMSGLAAAAKRAGVSMKVVGQIDQELRGLKGGTAILMALNGSFNELVEQGAKAGTIDKLVGGYEEMLVMTDGMQVGVRDLALAQMGVSGEMRAMLQSEKERKDVMMAASLQQGMSQEAAHAKWVASLALEKKVATLRQKAMDDYQGSVNTLTQQLQDMFAPLKAKAAEAMLPFVEGLVKIVKAVGPAVMDMIGAAMEYLMAMGDALWRVFEVLLPVFAVIGKAIQIIIVIGYKLGAVLWKMISATLSLLKPLVLALKFVAAILMGIGDVIIFVFGGLLDAIGSVLDAFSWLMDTLFSVETMMSALKYAAYALAIAFWPITLPLYLAYKAIMLIWDALKYVFGVVSDIVGGAFGEIGGFFSEVWGLFSGIFGAIGDFFGEVFGDIGEIFSPLVSAFKALWPIIKPILAGIGLALLAVFAPVLIPIMLVVGAIYAIGKVFKWLTGLVKSLKKWMFSSSFLHIAEGIEFILPFFEFLSDAISFLLTPIKLIGAAFGWLFDLGGKIFGGLVSLITSPFDTIGAIAGAIGDTLGDAWDSATDFASDAISGVGDAIGGAYDSVTGALSDAASAVGDTVSDAWNWLTGDSPSKIEKDSLDSVKNMGLSVEQAYALLESPWTSAVGSLGDAMSSAWDWLTGEDTGTTDTIKAQLASAKIVGPATTATAPMYTSKFDEDTKRSGKERSADLVMLQQETVALLTQILDKNDPDNKRTAEAMERIADKTGEAKQQASFRSRKGFGEHATQWWISK